MTDPEVTRFLAECKGMSDEEITAAHYADYYDKTKPHLRTLCHALRSAKQVY